MADSPSSLHNRSWPIQTQPGVDGIRRTWSRG
jgi:hypothetical protein